MFSIISFQSNGERIAHAGIVPAFYGLVYNGTIIDYFGTLAALHCAIARLECLYADAITSSYRVAA
jgi:hypothetical protein